MWIYRDIFYPIKKVFSGKNPIHFNAEYWERYAKSKAYIEKLFQVYTKEKVQEDWSLLAPHLPKSKWTFIDVGCGEGSSMSYFKKIAGERFCKGIGIDVSASILQVAKQRNPNFNFFNIDLISDTDSIPHELLGVADMIYCHSVLHSIPKAKLPFFFSRLHQMLKPGGIVWILWWAPYFFDETWIVPFAPMSHRHHDQICRLAAQGYFERIDLCNYSKKLKPSKNIFLRLIRSVFSSFHPKNTGAFLGKKKL